MTDDTDTLSHTKITDPYFSRLRKALAKAEDFLFWRASDVAIGRWNKIINKAKRLGALK